MGPVVHAAPVDAPPLPLSEYFQESWTTADGLPHNLVSDIVQTPEGYLWFGTWEGAVRYNGHRFDVFAFSHRPYLRRRKKLAIAFVRLMASLPDHAPPRVARLFRPAP